MITLKQMEALHWIVRFGSFERAAQRLHTTQSSISKRIQQLEAALGYPVLDRGHRGTALTEEGERVLALVQEMLGLRQSVLDIRPGDPRPRRLRLGVTELCALTWLPRLITRLCANFPGIEIEPEVDLSLDLHERLLADGIDLIIIPEGLYHPDLVSVRLEAVANAWMARPGLVDTSDPLPMDRLIDYPVLIQGGRSGSGLFLSRWMTETGLAFDRTLATDSLIALVGLTVAGLGVSYLPRECFTQLVALGKLAVVETTPPLPSVPYAAIVHAGRRSAFLTAVVELAAELCDFRSPLQS